MKVPICVLVIGNIPGSRRLEELDQGANSEEVAAVTRSQEKRAGQSVKPQIVAKSDIPSVSANH